MKITGTTKKQARKMIFPLIKEVEQLNEDLRKVTHRASVVAISGIIETKEELIQAYKDYVGEWEEE